MAEGDLLTVGEVAQTLRVNPTTVRRWVVQGALEAVYLPRLGKHQSYRIKREVLSVVLKGINQQ